MKRGRKFIPRWNDRWRDRRHEEIGISAQERAAIRERISAAERADVLARTYGPHPFEAARPAMFI